MQPVTENTAITKNSTSPETICDPHRRALAFWDKHGEALYIKAAGIRARTNAPRRHALRRQFLEKLDRIRAAGEDDPFSNSVSLLSLDIVKRLHEGDITPDDIDILIQHLSVSAFAFRARRMALYRGETRQSVNEKTIERHLIRAITENGQILPFEHFKALVEQENFGIVFTAHPTFSLNHDLLRALCHLSLANGDDPPSDILADIARTPHLPERPITLETEHRLAADAIRHAQAALRRLNAIIFKIARKHYPDQCHTLVPRMISLASWVGYDIDGRDDITWIDSLHKRLQVQFHQLAHYRTRLDRVISCNQSPSKNAPLHKTLISLQSRLEKMSNEIKREINAFHECRKKKDDREMIGAIARSMHKGLDQRLIRSEDLIVMITRAIGQCQNDIGKKCIHDLCLLRAEIAGYGLASAHTHFRINASQLHNAICNDIDMEGDPGDPARRRTYIRRLNTLLGKVRPVTINFGSLLDERMSAKRLFMIVTQMLKYMDKTTAVRFLIAECETPLSALSALYFARLFGVADSMDISPLFETERALAKGHHIIDELLANPHWRRYIRARGQLAIQTGYSDSGRYIGQVAAGLAIENLHVNIARVLEKHGLKNIKVIMFNTHGESIGRGAHPQNMAERMRYVSSDYARTAFARNGLRLKEEISFQGGDGYSWFMNNDSAFAVISRIGEHCLAPIDKNKDPFYDRPDYGAEMADGVKQFNASLMDNPSYMSLLRLFSTHSLYPSGSRPVQRSDENIVESKNSGHPSQMRAIPQNAILQQLGFFANSLGGVGRAFASDRDKFLELQRHSHRFQNIAGIAEYAFAFSDFEILKANVGLFDPGAWLSNATRCDDPILRESMKKMADTLMRRKIYGQISPVADHFHREYLSIREWILGSGRSASLAVGTGRIIEKKYRDDLLLLHALKIAMIREIFLLAMRVPPFSYQKGHSHSDIIARILGLDIDYSLQLLRNIFPLRSGHRNTVDFGEKATYHNSEAGGYAGYHRDIFDPIERLYAAVRRLSHGIVDFIGAIG